MIVNSNSKRKPSQQLWKSYVSLPRVWKSLKIIFSIQSWRMSFVNKACHWWSRQSCTNENKSASKSIVTLLLIDSRLVTCCWTNHIFRKKSDEVLQSLWLVARSNDLITVTMTKNRKSKQEQVDPLLFRSLQCELPSLATTPAEQQSICV